MAAQVRVITPGHHEAVVSTATTDDAQTIADMLRHCGCTATLIIGGSRCRKDLLPMRISPPEQWMADTVYRIYDADDHLLYVGRPYAEDVPTRIDVHRAGRIGRPHPPVDQ